MENKTEAIERYLNNLMDEGERAAFEQALDRDPELRAETELQDRIQKGIELAAARTEFSRAIQQRGLSMLALKAGLVLLTALLISAAVYLLKPKDDPKSETLSAQNETTALHTSDSSAMPGIQEQVFSLRMGRDTVIETRGGIVFAIQAGTFQTESGQAELKISEALKAADVLKAGLSTLSNGKLLETGGMFSIEAFENGRSLDMQKSILARVPTDSFDAGMLFYSGERDSSGILNWVKPVPISKPLQTVDIHTLDFYPPDYLKTLEKLGLPHLDKRYTDSLYFALSGYQPPVKKKVSERKNVQRQSWWRTLMEHGNGMIEVRFREKGQTKALSFKGWADFNRFDDSIQRTLIVKRPLPEDKTPKTKYNTEIDPARIQAIWNSRFNNTILATKAFEERLKFIFSTCQPRFLDLYVRHLDKTLSEIDSMCAAVSGGSYREKFLEFYRRKDGGVPIEKGVSRKLNRYFETQHTAYRKAAENTRAELRKALAAQTDAEDRARLKAALEALEREGYETSDAFCRNLKRAYEALGETVQCPKPTPAPAKGYYEVSITRPGFYNVDKPAPIFLSADTKPSYSPLELTVNQYEAFDRVMVYLLPGGLRSFQRITLQVNGTFRSQLNDFIFYDAVVLAFKGDGLFFARKKQLGSGRHLMEPKPVSEAEFETLMQPYDFGGNNNAYTYALNGLGTMTGAGNIKERLARLKAEQANEQILQAVFPCFDKGIQTTEIKTK